MKTYIQKLLKKRSTKVFLVLGLWFGLGLLFQQLGFGAPGHEVWAAPILNPSPKEAGFPGGFATWGIGKLALLFAIIGYIVFVWPLSQVASLLLYLLEIVAHYGVGEFTKVSGVVLGWTVVRDLSNLFFIVVLLVIAFSTALRIKSYNYQTLLPRLVIAALLINFSKTIAGLFIDFSQVIMDTFMTAIEGKIGGGIFINALGLQKILIFQPKAPDSWFTNGLANMRVLTTMIMGAILLALFCTVLLMYIVTLIFRVVMLWVLVVLSPLAYISWTFPKSQKYWSQWWSEFGSWITVGPVTAFFLWLSLTIFTLDAGPSTGGMTSLLYRDLPEGGFGAGISAIGNPEAISNFIIALALLIAGQKFIQNLNTIAGSAFQKWAGRAAAFGAGFVVGKVGLAGWNAANTLGGRANWSRYLGGKGKPTDTITGRVSEGILGQAIRAPVIAGTAQNLLAKKQAADRARAKAEADVTAGFTKVQKTRVAQARGIPFFGGSLTVTGQLRRESIVKTNPHLLGWKEGLRRVQEDYDDDDRKAMKPHGWQQLRTAYLAHGGTNTEAGWHAEMKKNGLENFFKQTASYDQALGAGLKKTVTNGVGDTTPMTNVAANTEMFGTNVKAEIDKMVKFASGVHNPTLDNDAAYYDMQAKQQAIPANYVPTYSQEEVGALNAVKEADGARYTERYKAMGGKEGTQEERQARSAREFDRISNFNNVLNNDKKGLNSAAMMVDFSVLGKDFANFGGANLRGEQKDAMAAKIADDVTGRRMNEIETMSGDDLVKDSFRRQNVKPEEMAAAKEKILAASPERGKKTDEEIIKQHYTQKAQTEDANFRKAVTGMDSLRLLNKMSPTDMAHKSTHEKEGHDQLQKLGGNDDEIRARIVKMWEQLPKDIQTKLDARIRAEWANSDKMSTADVAEEAFSESIAHSYTMRRRQQAGESPEMLKQRAVAAGPYISPEVLGVLESNGVRLAPTRKGKEVAPVGEQAEVYDGSGRPVSGDQSGEAIAKQPDVRVEVDVKNAAKGDVDAKSTAEGEEAETDVHIDSAETDGSEGPTGQYSSSGSGGKSDEPKIDTAGLYTTREAAETRLLELWRWQEKLRRDKASAEALKNIQYEIDALQKRLGKNKGTKENPEA